MRRVGEIPNRLMCFQAKVFGAPPMFFMIEFAEMDRFRLLQRFSFEFLSFLFVPGVRLAGCVLFASEFELGNLR